MSTQRVHPLVPMLRVGTLFAALRAWWADRADAKRPLSVPTQSVGTRQRLPPATRPSPLTTGHWLLLLALLALATWLRWRYVQEISLYIDEFTTLWAAQRVQALGAPIMPSGVLYTRGLLASYIEAAFLSLFGFSYTVGRLPSVLFGLATIVATWLMGRRLWQPTVGWLAALGLTLLPEAIIWSGRARFYAQLQFLVLLLVWAGFRLITTSPPTPPQVGKGRNKPLSPSWRGGRGEVIFVVLFALALFSQEETILLYPPLLLATWLWQGGAGLRQPRTILTHLACLGLMGGRYALEIWGQPGYFETIQADRPYMGLAFDLLGAWYAYAPLLIAPERLLWTVAGLLAVAVALWAGGRVTDWPRAPLAPGESVTRPCLASHGLTTGRRWTYFLTNPQGQLTALPIFHQATLFFALHFGFVLGVILFLVGSTWRDSRYLFLVQPLWLLVGGAGLVWLIERIAYSAEPVFTLRYMPHAARSLWLLTSATILATLWPSAQRVFSQQVEGYDRALAYLAEQRQADDVVLSPQPPACALALGAPCDYYALQRGYAEYVIQRGETLVDRWTGAPLLNQTAQLQQVVQQAPRTWLVSDSLRLATRYEPDFTRMIIEQFDIALAERGVLVLQATGWRPQPIYTISQTLATPLTFAPLALTGWERGAATPGQELAINLFWRSITPVGAQYNTSLKVLAADGHQVTQDDGPPARGVIPTTLFFDTPLPDPKRLALPPDLAPGRYALQISVYDVATVTPVGAARMLDWFTVGPPPSPPRQPLHGQWRNGLTLMGTDGLPATVQVGESFTLRLVWQTNAPVTEEYTVFVHLIGADGQPIAQADRAPEGGFYPTSGWDVGEVVADTYTLGVPTTAAAGTYQLVVGFYRPETNERLALAAGEDRLNVGQVAVQK